MATALARRVFPVPGGPYSRIPVRFRPRTSNSGCCSGSCTVSKISFLTCCRPPTSSQRTSGICSQRYYSHIYSDISPQGQQESTYITLGAPTALAWTSCSVSNATVKSWFKRVTPLLHSSFCCPPLDKHIQNQRSLMLAKKSFR